jgi:hypothetical protein
MSDDPQIVAFENMDDAFAFMAANERAAIARMSPKQQGLADGDEHWYYRIVMFGDEKLAIFGHVPALHETLKQERSYYVSPMSDDDAAEYDSIEDNLRDSLSRGYVFSKNYSTVEILGELGSVHVSSVVPCTQETFEFARVAGWSTKAPGMGANLLLMMIDDFTMYVD